MGCAVEGVADGPDKPCRIRRSASLCSGDRLRRHTACGLAETGQGAIVLPILPRHDPVPRSDKRDRLDVAHPTVRAREVRHSLIYQGVTDLRQTQHDRYLDTKDSA